MDSVDRFIALREEAAFWKAKHDAKELRNAEMKRIRAEKMEAFRHRFGHVFDFTENGVILRLCGSEFTVGMVGAEG